MYIQWKKSYETGHPLIDAEHRLLVMLFRKLDVAIKTRESETTISRIVQEVKQYVKFHFTSEENLMHETNYSGIEGHIALHAQLLMELNNQEKHWNKTRLRNESARFFRRLFSLSHTVLFSHPR